MILKGKLVKLRPMKEDEINVFFKWATQSDATPFWYGELYGDEIPTFEKFTKNWNNNYFTDNNPELGRCFTIIVDDAPIGMVNYNKIDSENKAELDIIIADSFNWEKGYGSDAIKTLIKFLFEELNVRSAWIAASKKNPRAIKSYKKSGFEISSPPKNLMKDPYWSDKKLEDHVFLSLNRLTMDIGDYMNDRPELIKKLNDNL